MCTCCQGLQHLDSDPTAVCLLSRVVIRFAPPSPFVLRVLPHRNQQVHSLAVVFCVRLQTHKCTEFIEQPQSRKVWMWSSALLGAWLCGVTDGGALGPGVPCKAPCAQ